MTIIPFGNTQNSSPSPFLRYQSYFRYVKNTPANTQKGAIIYLKNKQNIKIQNNILLQAKLLFL